MQNQKNKSLLTLSRIDDNIKRELTPSFIEPKIPKTPAIKQFGIINPKNDINNQIMLAISEDSFSREVSNNAVAHPSNASIIIWGSTNPAHVGLEGYSKVKLSCYNNGAGMTADILDKVTEFSSSHEKPDGINGNKGKGEKLSGMAINQKGMVWISCALDLKTNLRKIHRAVMIGNPETGEWGKQIFMTENEHSQWPETIVDITDIIDLEALGLDIDQDWTLKIYCGNATNQNTIENPYGTHPNGISEGWLVRELSRRFPILPTGVEIQISHAYLTNNNKSVFQPVLDAIKNNTQNGVKFETITVTMDPTNELVVDQKSLGEDIPFFTPSGTINITYVHDPFCNAKGNEKKSTVWYHSRMGVTGVFSGLIYRNELYDFRGPLNKRGAPNWKSTAMELGIVDGYEQFRIFVSLPESKHIDNNENRTEIIDLTDPKKSKIELKNYRNHVQGGMPQWFRDLMEQMAPKTPDDSTIQSKLNEKMKAKLLTQSASRHPGGSGQGFPNEHTHTNECPDCKKNNIVTVILRGVRKCPVCGYIKPPSNSGLTSPKNGGLIPDPNGKAKMIKQYPEIKRLEKDEWNGLSLCDEFPNMAAQYDDKGGVLYINMTFSAFENLRSTLLTGAGITENHPKFDQASAQAQKDAILCVLYDCLGDGIISAIMKLKMNGFKDDEVWKRNIHPSVLSVYADNWINDSIQNTYKLKFKNWCRKYLEINSSDEIVDDSSNLSGLEERLIAAGGNVPSFAD
jgi:hypothetical protein